MKKTKNLLCPLWQISEFLELRKRCLGFFMKIRRKNFWGLNWRFRSCSRLESRWSNFFLSKTKIYRDSIFTWRKREKNPTLSWDFSRLILTKSLVEMPLYSISFDSEKKAQFPWHFLKANLWRSKRPNIQKLGFIHFEPREILKKSFLLKISVIYQISLTLCFLKKIPLVFIKEFFWIGCFYLTEKTLFFRVLDSNIFTQNTTFYKLSNSVKRLSPRLKQIFP